MFFQRFPQIRKFYLGPPKSDVHWLSHCPPRIPCLLLAHCSQLQMFPGIIAIMGFRCHWTHLQLQRWNGPCQSTRIHHRIQLPQDHLWLAEVQISGCVFFVRIHDFCPISEYGTCNPMEGSSCRIYFSRCDILLG